MAKVYLALGSNVGNGDAQFDAAIGLLADKLENIKQAKRYTSKAFGFTDQPDFLNTALEAETNLQPLELLSFVKDVEARVGRIKRFRWGPREIDIDIVFYGDEIVNEPNLQIPHVSFNERDFVLKPLCDLTPSLSDPKSHKTIQQIYDDLPESAKNII